MNEVEGHKVSSAYSQRMLTDGLVPFLGLYTGSQTEGGHGSPGEKFMAVYIRRSWINVIYAVKLLILYLVTDLKHSGVTSVILASVSSEFENHGHPKVSTIRKLLDSYF